MKNRNSEKGFSLVELCFVAAIFMFVLYGVFKIYSHVQKKESLQDEFAESIEHYNQIDIAFRKDFDTAGFNFYLPHDFRFSGGDYPLYVFTHQNWQFQDDLRTDGVTLHQTAVSNDFLHSSLIFRTGTGAASFRATPGEYKFVLRSVGGENTRYLQVSGSNLSVIENGAVVSVSESASNAVRREASISIEYLKNNPNTCVVAYYLYDSSQNKKSLIYRSPLACPSYPMEIAVQSSVAPIDLKNLKIAGTDMLNRDTAISDFVLPSYQGAAISRPNVIVENSNHSFQKMVSLGGDLQSDVFYTKSNIVVKQNTSVIVPITKPFSDAVLLSNNDVVNLIDHPGRHSVIGVVSGVSAASFTFTPLSSNQSYSGFYTLPANYDNQQFFAGASVVKLAAPSEFQLSGDRLMQRTGSRPWQIVMLGIDTMSIQTNTRQTDPDSNIAGQSTMRGYDVFINFNQDGTESADEYGYAQSQIFHVFYTPKAVNRDANN